MIRKFSQKALFPEEKPVRVEAKVEENEYYLPQPNAKGAKLLKEEEREKPSLKASRKATQNGSLRTYSIALFKPDTPANDSKELTASTSHKLKVERKIRSSSHSEAMQMLNSKSALKLQLNRKDHPVRRINLKLETPKKPQKEADYDSYYNGNSLPAPDFKTVRAQNRGETTGHSSGRASKSTDFTTLYSRCLRLVEDYQQQLDQAKRDNALLVQENKRLRGERGC